MFREPPPCQALAPPIEASFSVFLQRRGRVNEVISFSSKMKTRELVNGEQTVLLSRDVAPPPQVCN